MSNPRVRAIFDEVAALLGDRISRERDANHLNCGLAHEKLARYQILQRGVDADVGLAFDEAEASETLIARERFISIFGDRLETSGLTLSHTGSNIYYLMRVPLGGLDPAAAAAKLAPIVRVLYTMFDDEPGAEIDL